MAAEDAKLKSYIPYLLILFVVWYFRRFLMHHTYYRIYAWVLDKFAQKINKGYRTRQKKKQLFNELKNYRSKFDRGLKVLEIGAGSAANLDFFPDSTSLVCLEPNPHFEGYVRRNLDKNKSVILSRIVRGYAEDMPFEDQTFDAVVCTLVLCTVSDPEKSLSEILRVLKPVSICRIVVTSTATCLLKMKLYEDLDLLSFSHLYPPLPSLVDT